MSIAWLNVSYIQSRASSGSYGRSHSLRSDVEDLESDGMNSWSARVHGSRPYQIQVTDEGEELECYCSCPDNRGGWCKHICAVLQELLPSGGASRGSRVSPVRTTPTAVSPIQSRSPVKSAHTPSKSTDQSKLNELVQMNREYASSRDGALLAKMAGIIYKQCKEARDIAQFHPKRANELIVPLVRLYGENDLPREPQIASLDETVANTAAMVISFSRDANQIRDLATALQNWTDRLTQRTWGRVPISPIIADAKECATRKCRTAPKSTHSLNHLLR